MRSRKRKKKVLLRGEIEELSAAMREKDAEIGVLLLRVRGLEGQVAEGRARNLALKRRLVGGSLQHTEQRLERESVIAARTAEINDLKGTVKYLVSQLDTLTPLLNENALLREKMAALHGQISLLRKNVKRTLDYDGAQGRTLPLSDKSNLMSISSSYRASEEEEALRQMQLDKGSVVKQNLILRNKVAVQEHVIDDLMSRLRDLDGDFEARFLDLSEQMEAREKQRPDEIQRVTRKLQRAQKTSTKLRMERDHLASEASQWRARASTIDRALQRHRAHRRPRPGSAKGRTTCALEPRPPPAAATRPWTAPPPASSSAAGGGRGRARPLRVCPPARLSEGLAVS